jgi:alkylation response protein AidB-like acyl-CoA dehydrogenase
VDFDLSVAERAFQLEARDWLHANRPRWNAEDELDPERWMALRRTWQSRLHENRYVGLMWPREFGGRGATAAEQLIFNEEAIDARVPEPANVIALGMIGPTIISHGTEAQKARYLDMIMSADEIWCQPFSEPNAGSDLSALATRAEDRGDHYVVSGQKVWSFAHLSAWCMLLAREQRLQNPRQGLTMLLVDMRSPGIEVRPLVQMTRDPEFNEIYFNDVGIPKSQVLGEPGQGWQMAMTTLLHERGNLGVTLATRGAAAIRELISLARATRPRPDRVLRHRIAQHYIESRVIQLNSYKVAAEIDRSGVPGPDASMVKLGWSVLNQGLAATARDLLGPAAAVEG